MGDERDMNDEKQKTDAEIHEDIIIPLAFQLFSDLQTNPLTAGQRKFTCLEYNGEMIGVFVDRTQKGEPQVEVIYPEQDNAE